MTPAILSHFPTHLLLLPAASAAGRPPRSLDEVLTFTELVLILTELLLWKRLQSLKNKQKRGIWAAVHWVDPVSSHHWGQIIVEKRILCCLDLPHSSLVSLQFANNESQQISNYSLKLISLPPRPPHTFLALYNLAHYLGLSIFEEVESSVCETLISHVLKLTVISIFSFQKTPTAHAMKEENFLRRRFSLCPASSTPQKVDPRKLTRNLFFGADNDIYPLSPGKFLLCQCKMCHVFFLSYCFSSTCETQCRTSGAWLKQTVFSTLPGSKEKWVNMSEREAVLATWVSLDPSEYCFHGATSLPWCSVGAEDIRVDVCNHFSTAWPHISEMSNVFGQFHSEVLDMFHPKHWTPFSYLLGPVANV